MCGIPGKIVINREICKGCGLCAQACKLGLIRISDDINSEGFHPATFDDKEGKCIACAFCYRSCPDVAIEVWRDEQKDIHKGQ